MASRSRSKLRASLGMLVVAGLACFVVVFWAGRLQAEKGGEEKAGQEGVTMLKQAVSNVRPTLEVKSRRVGGATYQVPVEVRHDRRTALALRWLIIYSSARAEKTMAERLAAELVSASRNEGASIKKREDTHKMAEANKAFAHYRW